MTLAGGQRGHLISATVRRGQVQSVTDQHASEI